MSDHGRQQHGSSRIPRLKGAMAEALTSPAVELLGQSAHQGSQGSTDALELAAMSGTVDEGGMSLAVSELEAGIGELLQGMDYNNVSLRQFRRTLSRHLGLGKNGLEARPVEVNGLVRDALSSMALAPQTPAQEML
jgi:hypothetical protein